MKTKTLICAAALAAATVSPAFAGGKAAPIIEDEVFVDTTEAGSLSSGGAGAVILGVIVLGAALASSSGT